MTLPELMNEQTRLGCKDELTEADKVRLGELNEALRRYREHPLGELMWGYHDLGCEWDGLAAHLDHAGQSFDNERSRADFFHQKAEETRQRIESSSDWSIGRYRLIAQVNQWAKDEFEYGTMEDVEGHIAADKATMDEHHPDLVADLGCSYLIIEQHLVRVETHGKTWGG